MPYYYDYSYLILILPAMLVTLWAQMKVKSAFGRYENQRTSNGLTGSQAARSILDSNGLYQVRIEQVSGSLTDHYDPKDNVIRLSDSVYGSASVSAVGVAAHEAGHAVQHAENYLPIRIRNAIIPVTNLGSTLSMPLILLGMLLSVQPLVTAGIALFSLVTVFQLITLPVEFNASSRALSVLKQKNLLIGEENEGAKEVLSAAAMTYVAALLVSFMQLLRLILLFGRRRND